MHLRWIYLDVYREKWRAGMNSVILGWLVVEHNCVNIGVFIDFVEQQIHVSAFIGHRQVVLREVNEFH